MNIPADQTLGSHPDFPESQVAFDEIAGFYRTFPYPSEEALERFYSREYRSIRQESPDDNYLKFMRHRANEQIRFIVGTSHRRSFDAAIDIGCGCGELLNALLPHANRLHGFETDVVMATHAKSRRSSESREIHNQHYSPREHPIKADLITMSHVLEHIPEPLDFLSILRANSLSSGGILFLEVPNEPSQWVKSQIDWQRKGLGHVNYFTRQSLEFLLERAGFAHSVSRECGKLVTSHMSAARPTTSLNQRLWRKMRRFLPAAVPLPDYQAEGGTSPRIYLQTLAFNTTN